jgi:predicted membrane-bound dolichyl-phosphate-mannose-protein mannosyltransferase
MEYTNCPEISQFRGGKKHFSNLKQNGQLSTSISYEVHFNTQQYDFHKKQLQVVHMLMCFSGPVSTLATVKTYCAFCKHLRGTSDIFIILLYEYYQRENGNSRLNENRSHQETS